MADRLVDAARDVQQHAYAPYSRYRVGAAVETRNGAVFVGCNVENASYGLTICAERAALAAAVAAGQTVVRRVAVVSDSTPPAAPCGACRQVLAEFGLDIEVIAVGPTETRRWRVAELLPDAFHRELLV